MSVIANVRQKLGRHAAEGVYDNPVVIKELRTRMRGTKAFVVMGGYVLLLTVVVVIAAFEILGEVLRSQDVAASIMNRSVGLRLFQVLSWTQAVLLTLVAPSLTSGALSQEVESKTMELLSLTRLTPGKIVLGKQLSGFFYALMLLVCSIPLAGICLMFGGVSPAEIAVTYLLLLAWAFLFTATGVIWSSLIAKTSVASLVSFATCAVYFGISYQWGVESQISHRLSSPERLTIFDSINPGWSSYAPLSAIKVCGLNVPVALAILVAHLSLGALALLVASTHLKYHRVERALSVRIMLIAISAYWLWLLVGNGMGVVAHLSGSIPSTVALGHISATGAYILMMIALGSIAIATGRLTTARGESFVAYALSPAKAFKSDLRGAISFLFFWTVVVYGVFGGTYIWAAKAEGIPVFQSFWPAYFKVGIALLAISVGLGSVGVLCSTLLKTRRNAAMMVFLIVLLLMAIYPVVRAYYEPGVSNPRAMVWQLAAFWPFMPILHTTGEMDSGGPMYWWGDGDAWLVSCIVYVLISMAALGAASALSAKYAGAQEE